MTVRRLVLNTADQLLTAFSLAFWLTLGAKTGSRVGRTSPLAKALLGAAAVAIPTTRSPGSSSAVDLGGHTIDSGPPPNSPTDPSGCHQPSPFGASAGVGSGSSGSEQIPLLMDRRRVLPEFRFRPSAWSRRSHFDGKSLNHTLSLGAGA
jgi:hypothetical protein